MDYPRQQIMNMAEEALQKFNLNTQVYFKYTCKKCGERRTFEEPNILYEYGDCECGHKTKVDKAGFMLEIRRN